MRRWFVVACRAFPQEHRARRGGEFVDTAFLAADGSAWRGFYEGLSLVVAGACERVRAERGMSVRDGISLAARLLALLNLAIALYGISLAVDTPRFGAFSWPCCSFPPDPYVVDWWWIAFAVSAVGVVVGLALARRALALGAALANLGIVGYDAFFLTGYRGHMNAFAPLGSVVGYPVGRAWLAPAVLLALGVAVAPLRRSLLRLPLMLVGAVLLDVLARRDPGGFIFLQWPFGLVVLLGVTVGWLAPRLAVVAIAASLALAPFVVAYLSRPEWMYVSPAVTWIAAPGLALGIVLPLAYLARRRLT